MGIMMQGREAKSVVAQLTNNAFDQERVLSNREILPRLSAKPTDPRQTTSDICQANTRWVRIGQVHPLAGRSVQPKGRKIQRGKLVAGERC